jgi:drug/metabolite transporter (DMT)-like permease
VVQQQNQNPAQRLMVLRIIWGALLTGLLVFFGVVIVIGPSRPKPDPQLANLLLYVAVAMLAAEAPVAFLVRSLVYRKGHTEAGVSPEAYATGNIIFWAMFEGVGFFALVAGLQNQGRGPHLVVAAIAIAMIVVNFPTGGPLRRE